MKIMEKIKRINLNIVWHTMLAIIFVIFLYVTWWGYYSITEIVAINISRTIKIIIWMIPILIVIAFIQGKEFFKKIPLYYDLIKLFLGIFIFFGVLVILSAVPYLACGACSARGPFEGYEDIMTNILLPIWIFAIIYLVVLKILVLIINLFIKKEIWKK